MDIMTKQELVLLITPVIRQYVEINSRENVDVTIKFKVQDSNLVFVTVSDEEKIKVR